ncbi:amidohydrolase [Apodospora peruviana]|uniref:6-methylsalicylate decarboxylase n=1 Tax=Apodospora peruviana TaxID=516989 RepID=A0AAE0M3N4_9PEZI|nr:amidohydrolase [Apodospora peruviana]
MKYFITSVCWLAHACNSAQHESPKTKIDVHTHFLPDFYAQALRDAGHLPGPDGMPGIPTWNPSSHLVFMASNNIAKAYLSISSPGVYLSVPSRAATRNATALARRVNTYASHLKSLYPAQFGFFAALPLPDIAASLREIDHCFTNLDPPPDGVVLLSNFYGLYLGDPALDPVYAALNKLNVTIFEHPTSPCTAYNHFKYSNIDAAEDAMISPHEWQAMNIPVANRQPKAPILEFPFDTARTFTDLFYSEVPKRFPGIRWIMPHGGGGLVPTMDRVVGFSPPEINLTESVMKSTLAKNFYFDLAGPWPVTFAVPSLLRWVGYEKLLWGSDTPWTPWALATNVSARFDVEIDEVFNESVSKARAVRYGNAARLFGYDDLSH